MIQRAQEEKLPWSEVSRLLDSLQKACDQHDIEQVRAVLAEAVPGYSSPMPVRLPGDTRVPGKLCVIQGGNTNVQGYVLRKTASDEFPDDNVAAAQLVATNFATRPGRQNNLTPPSNSPGTSDNDTV